ncbi:MAG: type II toxin-antitoxin system PemK/MazF family toxin [Lachnospiraceae bacterium]
MISNDKGNKHSTTVIVAAITGMERAKAKLPTHIIAKTMNTLINNACKSTLVLLTGVSCYW